MEYPAKEFRTGDYWDYWEKLTKCLDEQEKKLGTASNFDFSNIFRDLFKDSPQKLLLILTASNFDFSNIFRDLLEELLKLESIKNLHERVNQLLNYSDDLSTKDIIDLYLIVLLLYRNERTKAVEEDNKCLRCYKRVLKFC